MSIKSLGRLVLVFGFVLFSYGLVNAQVVDAVKKAAEKTKEVTVDAAKKTAEVTVDAAKKTANVTGDVAGGTKDVTVKGAKKTADVAGDVYDKGDDVAADTAELTMKGFDKSDDIATDVWEASAKGTKKTVQYTGNNAAQFGKLGYTGVKTFTQKTWDGTKWVSQRVYVFTKNEVEDL